MCRLVPRQVGSAPVCGAGISLLLPLLWPLLQWCVLCRGVHVFAFAPGGHRVLLPGAAAVTQQPGLVLVCCWGVVLAGPGVFTHVAWVHLSRWMDSPVVGPCLRVAGVVDVLVVWVGSQTQQLQWCVVAAWCLHWHGARCAGVPRCRPPCLLCLRCSARLVGCCGPELLVGVGSESGGSGEYCGGGWLLGSAPGLGCCCLVLRALSAAAAPVLLSALTRWIEGLGHKGRVGGGGAWVPSSPGPVVGSSSTACCWGAAASSVLVVVAVCSCSGALVSPRLGCSPVWWQGPRGTRLVRTSGSPSTWPRRGAPSWLRGRARCFHEVLEANFELRRVVLQSKRRTQVKKLQQLQHVKQKSTNP